MRTVTDLGVIGTTRGILSPLDLPLDKDGAPWPLTGYIDQELRIRNWFTGEAVALGGTVTIEDAANGVIRYEPSDPDTIYAEAGTYEARVYVRPGAGRPLEMSGRFTFEIAEGP